MFRNFHFIYAGHRVAWIIPLPDWNRGQVLGGDATIPLLGGDATFPSWEGLGVGSPFPAPRFHEDKFCEDKFYEDKGPIQTCPRENGDKTVTNPSLKAGVIRCVGADRP